MKHLETSLSRLALHPPQALLLEGGSEQERLNLALFWAKAANCPQAIAFATENKAAIPCGNCPVCKQIDALEYADIWIFDGRISNREDEEKPGLIRALRIENIRELKATIAVKPHGSGKRVAILQGMYQTREEALNSLLKTLEEPGEFTLFVLLTPQRQQILPTLVSRSLCLTLPWVASNYHDPNMENWEKSLALFFQTGQGLLETVAAKGNVDSNLCAQILLCCQRALCRVFVRENSNEIDKIFAPLAAHKNKSLVVSRWLSEAQEMLQLGVSPARILEAFLTNVYAILRMR